MQPVISKAEFVHDARPKVLDHNVAVHQQRLYGLDCIRLFQVQRNRTLAAIDRLEQQAFVVFERTDMPVIIPVKGLNLYHLSTKVRHHRGTIRPCKNTGKIKDADAR